jgi:hypothetical protein
VIFGIDVDADRFEAPGEFVLEVGERERTVGGESEWRAADDLDAAAEGGGSVVSDAERKEGQRKIALAGFVGDAGGTALKG